MADSPQSMRAFLARLDLNGDLLTVEAPVEVDFEVAACLAEARDGPALCFRQPVRGGARFAAPIVALLSWAVYEPTIANTLPQTAAALNQWSGVGLPDEPVFQAFASDLKAAQAAGVIYEFAKSLNTRLPGSRSQALRIARRAAFSVSSRRERASDCWRGDSCSSAPALPTIIDQARSRRTAARASSNRSSPGAANSSELRYWRWLDPRRSSTSAAAFIAGVSLAARPVWG